MHDDGGNPNVLVLNSDSVPEPQQPGEQEPIITRVYHIATSYSYCQEHRSFYPWFNYEVVKVQVAPNPYVPPVTFHVLNFPIDQLGQDLTARATQLENLRNITFHNPLSWEVLITNYIPIMEMALRILTHAPLTKITFCADVLNDQLFRTLREKLCLREVEILLPSIAFHFPYRLAHIGDVLNRGITQLPQVEHFKIPFELVTSALLVNLGELPHLHVLKITNTANAPYPGRSFIECLSYIQNPRIFATLQLLDIGDNQSQEDFSSKDTLTEIFPNTKFIKT